jgi:spore coat polysaccharide biosynthesis predicted glycosyltransferase SpsG
MHSDRWFFFRVEASYLIGFGHFRRTLAIALKLSEQNRVCFFTESEPVRDACHKNGFLVINCTDDPAGYSTFINIYPNAKIEGIIIDTKSEYSINQVHKLNAVFGNSFFIENTSEGTKLATCIVYPAAHFDYESVYGRLAVDVPHEKILAGPEYVIIRDEIKRHHAKTGGGIVITTGGSDPCNVMQSLSNMITTLEINANFLIGQNFNSIQANAKNTKFCQYSNYCVRQIASADIVICTFGVSVYEALFFRKPVISVAHNLENAIGSKLLSKKYDMIADIGCYSDLSLDVLENAISKFQKPSFQNYKSIIDGDGVDRICEKIKSYV